MYNEDTEMLFPPRVIPTLRQLRGDLWRDLVNRVISLDATALDRVAFVLLMIRLGGCSSCQSDSFRAMRGCTQCAQQTVRRYRGSEQDLLKGFNEARNDVEKYLMKRQS